MFSLSMAIRSAVLLKFCFLEKLIFEGCFPHPSGSTQLMLRMLLGSSNILKVNIDKLRTNTHWISLYFYLKIISWSNIFHKRKPKLPSCRGNISSFYGQQKFSVFKWKKFGSYRCHAGGLGSGLDYFLILITCWTTGCHILKHFNYLSSHSGRERGPHKVGLTWHNYKPFPPPVNKIREASAQCKTSLCLYKTHNALYKYLIILFWWNVFSVEISKLKGF